MSGELIQAWLATDHLALGSRLPPAAREEGQGAHVSPGAVYKCPDVSMTLERKWRGSEGEGQELPPSVLSVRKGRVSTQGTPGKFQAFRLSLNP